MAETRFPHLAAAMAQAAVLVQQQWQQQASQMLTTPGQRSAYTSAIEAGPVTEGPGGFSVVVTNTWHAARTIEEGHGPYHLPDTINWSRARGARRSKRGTRYLIIPFRHYSAQRGIRAQAATPTARRQMLTRAVYHVAQRLQRGQYLTAGPSRGQAVHAPGLQPYVPRFARNLRPGYTHAALQEGLRRTPGPRGVSRFLTFRTMTEHSAGWWIPGQAARPIAATTARQVTPAVHKLLSDAAREDVVTILNISVGRQRPPTGGA